MNNELKSKLKEIRKMEWVKSMRGGPAGVGYTLEKLLGKDADTFCYPDYQGIEIKTYRRGPNKYIGFFSLVPDGDYLFPYDRILKYIGYPHKQYPEYKIFNMDFYATEFTRINSITNGKIKVNWSDKKVSLYVSKFGRSVPINVSWSFDEIIKRVNIKMNRLLLVEARHRCDGIMEEFYYSKFKYYEIKCPEIFIYLIEQGIIGISIKLGIYTDKERFGRTYDHGCTFKMKIENIDYLYYLKDEF